MQTYYYLLASQRFLLEEEPLEEVLRERTRNYREQEKELDFLLNIKNINLFDYVIFLVFWFFFSF